MNLNTSKLQKKKLKILLTLNVDIVLIICIDWINYSNQKVDFRKKVNRKLNIIEIPLASPL